MNHTLIIFALILGAFALLTWATIWSRRETWVRLASVLGFFIVLVGLGPASMEGLGFHRPMWAAWRLEEKSELLILSFKLIRNVGIFLYIDAGPGEPRAISLPWSDEEAERMQKARRGNQRNGDKSGRIILRFNRSLDTNERQYHPLPQPVVPLPKPEPIEEPTIYERGV